MNPLIVQIVLLRTSGDPRETEIWRQIDLKSKWYRKGISTMVKSLRDLNVKELRWELRNRQLDTKDRKEELLDRLESWKINNGYEVDDSFDEKVEIMAAFKNLQEQLRTETDNLRSHIKKDIKSLRGEFGTDVEKWNTPFTGRHWPHESQQGGDEGRKIQQKWSWDLVGECKKNKTSNIRVLTTQWWVTRFHTLMRCHSAVRCNVGSTQRLNSLWFQNLRSLKS